MSSDALLGPIAERIRNAYTGGTIPPIRNELSVADVDTAYRIQWLNSMHWQAQGRRIIGRKIGLTSVAVQRQLKIDQPDFGVLFEDMLVDEDSPLMRTRLIQPKVEAEVAFVLGRDLVTKRPTVADILNATDYLLPALEIVDSRIEKWDIGILDTIADNASAGLFVLGSTPTDPRGVDLRTCGMILEVNGRLASQGVGAACLGNPLHAVRWLAQTLARLETPLCTGDVVLSGALGPMVPLDNATTISATIGGVGMVRAAVDAGRG